MINSKKLERVEKLLGAEMVSNMEKLSVESLEKSIVLAESAMKEACESLDTNAKYQELKESLKAITAGVREVKKFQNAKIALVLHLLEEKGQQ